MFRLVQPTDSAEHTSPPGLPPGRFVHLPGRGSMFVRGASGPPGAPAVILLHGLGATADLNWHCAFTSLGRHFRVIAPDHRGHGRGVRSHAPFRLTDCADDVVALADDLGIDRFTAVGYSMSTSPPSVPGVGRTGAHHCHLPQLHAEADPGGLEHRRHARPVS